MRGPLVTPLPDGRSVGLDREVADRLSCGVLVLDPVEVRDEPAVAVATEDLARDLRDRYEGRLPSEIPGLAEGRTLYKSFGMDPSRHRPSSEALMRRVLKGRSLYRISNLVDTCNLCSLEFLLPVGMYDLDLIEGDVTLRTGREGEEYPGIRKGPVHLAGRLGLFDGQGPFGSPTSDSARTCTSPATRQVLAVLMATADLPTGAMEENLTLFADRFTEFCGATALHRAALNGAPE